MRAISYLMLSLIFVTRYYDFTKYLSDAHIPESIWSTNDVLLKTSQSRQVCAMTIGIRLQIKAIN